MEAPNMNAWTILTKSPFEIFGMEEEAEPFLEMLKNTLAPYYSFKSLTTILMCIPIIIYVTLVVQYPPFFKVPSFASEPLLLRPQNLRHFQFYRLFTSPLVFEELSTLLVICLILWSLGSFTEGFLGKRILIVFSGFYGLIGYTYYMTLPCFLVGCNFAYALMMWSDPSNPILYRKITLVLYSLIALAYFLIFINFSKEEKYSSYVATVYGLIMTFMLGIERDPVNLPTYRKVIQLASTIIFILLTSLFILNIVLYRVTIL